MFGCKINEKSIGDLDGSFLFKQGKTIFFTPDAPHNIKLARNALADMGAFIDENDELIEWKYIRLLHEVQLEEGLRFANKLSSRHIHYHRHKMIVCAQTISAPVANAIEFLKDNILQVPQLLFISSESLIDCSTF